MPSAKTRKIQADQKPLFYFLQKRPKILRVLEKYGVHFCAGCFITLASTPKKAASYHGVPDIERFLKELQRTASK